MNNLLVYIQYFGIILLIVEIACTLCQPSSQNQVMMLIFTASALINTIGYLLELKATNKQLALYAVKINYIGKPFIVLSMFLFVLNYCQVSYSKVFSLILFGIHTFIMLSVLTCDYQKWFYTKINYTQGGFYPHLVLKHGFLYYLYIVLVISYSIFMINICIKRYTQAKDHSKRIHMLYLISITLIPLASYIIYLTKITKGYDITAPSYILCATMLLICSVKYNLLGSLRVAKDDVIDNLRDGLVLFNNFSELLYINKKGEEIYSQLSNNEQPNALLQLKTLMDENNHLFIKDEVYSINQNAVNDKKKKIGSLIKIENITDSYYYTQRLQHAVKEKTKEINQMQNSFITSFTSLVEARDGLTGTHIRNTSHYVYLLCQELKKHCSYKALLTDEFIDIIIEAAPLHDIGKISIPDAILQKPGKLTSEEFEIIKTHTVIGEQIIEEIIAQSGENLKLRTACKMAKYHHEHWDGTGYPCGLKSEEIPLCARIMALADVYDALLSKRCYKEPMSKENALTIIKDGAGTLFDPVMTDVFLSIQF